MKDSVWDALTQFLACITSTANVNYCYNFNSKYSVLCRVCILCTMEYYEITKNTTDSDQMAQKTIKTCKMRKRGYILCKA